LDLRTGEVAHVPQPNSQRKPSASVGERGINTAWMVQRTLQFTPRQAPIP
jgi:hypothetical protein